VTIIFHVQKSFIYIYGYGHAVDDSAKWPATLCRVIKRLAHSLNTFFHLMFDNSMFVDTLLPWQLQHWLHYFQKCWKFQVSKKFFKFILKHFFSNNFFLWKKMLNCQIIILLIFIFLKLINHFTYMCWRCQGTMTFECAIHKGIRITHIKCSQAEGNLFNPISIHWHAFQSGSIYWELLLIKHAFSFYTKWINP